MIQIPTKDSPDMTEVHQQQVTHQQRVEQRQQQRQQREERRQQLLQLLHRHKILMRKDLQAQRLLKLKQVKQVPRWLKPMLSQTNKLLPRQEKLCMHRSKLT
jgi:hypothetical protein